MQTHVVHRLEFGVWVFRSYSLASGVHDAALGIEGNVDEMHRHAFVVRATETLSRYTLHKTPHMYTYLT